MQQSLPTRYVEVKYRLEEYKGAIEKIVELLYAKENISGDQVREIIEVYELENNIETKLEPRKETPSSKKIVIDD